MNDEIFHFQTIGDFTRALLPYFYGKGIDVGEHKDFGGVTGTHAENSYHHYNEAIDLRDWRPDLAPEYEGGEPVHWKERTARMAQRARELGFFDEILGPGDPGHDTHLHLAKRGDKPQPTAVTRSELEYLARGAWKDAQGQLRFDRPTRQQAGSQAVKPRGTEDAGSSMPAWQGAPAVQLSEAFKRRQQELMSETEALIGRVGEPGAAEPAFAPEARDFRVNYEPATGLRRLLGGGGTISLVEVEPADRGALGGARVGSAARRFS